MRAMQVVKRTGELVDFDAERIRVAISKAVQASGRDMSEATLDDVVEQIRDEIFTRFTDFYPNVENIQDIVEKYLVRAGCYEVAKCYILYRAERQKIRDQAQQRAVENAKLGKLSATKRDGRVVLFNIKNVVDSVRRLADDLRDEVSVDLVVREVINNVYDGVPTAQIEQAMVLAAAAFIERDPAYSTLAARLRLQQHYKEVIGRSTTDADRDDAYRQAFLDNLRDGVAGGVFDPELLEFDLARLADGLRPERDDRLEYLGVQTLCERYFARHGERVLELPQAFWMRVAMGLALREDDREARALEFYDLMSRLLFVPSTPTLFHSGTAHPQLSSCYLSTIEDDLEHIFKCLGDNSQLSKWSGGIGNDWTNIRATGARIHSTNVESQGVVPFLKIANDVTMAINRSGKRRGATCAYLETWHYDIEDFLDLRKNTGDERRRTHDMNTANWIPDLFMKRVREDGEWTLFSPDETPDLHERYGRAFEDRYEEYEAMARRGELRLHKTVSAVKLWRKMLTMLFETGHPWMTFKDPCNVRSPQDHVGVVHSSNLCTEITLNTSAEETAVCNLGSVNLARHIKDGQLDEARLSRTVHTAIRMLDNVIDINFYPTEEAERSNTRHRPIGLGLMGFQDALFALDLAFEAPEALTVADRVMEFISLNAILASSELARERGPYASYEGSKWDRGIFPLDTLDLLADERGEPIDTPRTSRYDWTAVREHVRRHGMRNSNTMAIAPTATISNIAGCFPCIEPIYKNIYVKANISGEFTVVNHYLVRELKALGLWDEDMLERLKHNDGSLQAIDGVPDEIKAKYKEAFEVDPLWAIELAAARAKWLDQSQALNVFMRGRSGKQLSEIYMAAWRKGVKTTYYLRTLGATGIEKSTVDAARATESLRRDTGVEATSSTPAPAAPQPAAATVDDAPPPSAPIGGGLMPSARAVHADGDPDPGPRSSASDGRRGASGAAGSTSEATPRSSEAAPPADATPPRAEVPQATVDDPRLCRIEDPECEACQ